MVRGPALHDWNDGKGPVHSISWAQHLTNLGLATAAAPAQQVYQGPDAPEKPAPVNPFFTAEDLQAINQFNTDYATQIQNMDFELGNLQTDTQYQKTTTDTAAKKNTADTADNAAARGIFYSSIKDAAVYDIEAQRALQSKFLDDKLTAATLNAGTQKDILARSKENFDKAMAAKQAANAQSANDVAASAWADAQAAWDAAKPGRMVTPAAPAAPTAKPGAPLVGLGKAFAPSWGSPTSKPAASKPGPVQSTQSQPITTKKSKVVFG